MPVATVWNWPPRAFFLSRNFALCSAIPFLNLPPQAQLHSIVIRFRRFPRSGKLQKPQLMPGDGRKGSGEQRHDRNNHSNVSESSANAEFIGNRRTSRMIERWQWIEHGINEPMAKMPHICRRPIGRNDENQQRNLSTQERATSGKGRFIEHTRRCQEASTHHS